jgi:hypothetical protein
MYHRKHLEPANLVDGSWSKQIANFGSHKTNIEAFMSLTTDKFR